MAELLPCPFCGAGESRIDHQNMWTGMRNQLVCVHIRHWCEKPSRSHLCITANTEEEAVAEWNKRAAAPPPAGAQQAVDVDALAQEIRRVDGSNSLGAGALAEALMPFLAATPAPEAAPTAALMQISDLLSSMFSGARAHVRGEDEEVVGYTVRNGALHKIVGILASYKPVIIPANLPKAHETITGLLCGTSEAAPSAKEGEALRLLFLEAIDWGRSYGQRLSLSDVTLQDVAQGYADKAAAALAAPSFKGLTPGGGPD